MIISEIKEAIKSFLLICIKRLPISQGFLMEKRGRKPKGRLKLDWKGALQDMKDQYTSVELQHKIQDWRGD